MTDRRTDRPIDMVAHREITLPKIEPHIIQIPLLDIMTDRPTITDQSTDNRTEQGVIGKLHFQ